MRIGSFFADRASLVRINWIWAVAVPCLLSVHFYLESINTDYPQEAQVIERADSILMIGTRVPGR